MANNTIQLPVSLQLEMKNSANQFKQLQANAQKIFDGLDPASAIGKSLNKVFNQLSSKVSDLDLITSQSIFSASDLKKSFTLMRDIDKLMMSLQKSAETTSATGLGIDTEALRQAKKELQDLYAEIAAQKRQSVGTLSKGDKRFDKLANTKDQTGFDASKNFEQNIKTMGKTADDARTKIANYTKALADANAVAAEATKNTGRKQSKYDNLTNRVKNAETKSVVNIAKKIDSMAADKSLSVDDQIAEYQKILDSQIASNGSFKSGGRQATDFFARMIGFTPEQIKASVSQTAPEYVDNVKKQLTDYIKKNPVNKQGQNVIQAQAAQVVKDSEGIDAVKAKQIKAAEELKTAQGESAAADAAVAAAKDNLTQVTNLLSTVEAQIKKLQDLRKDVYGDIDEQHSSQVNTAQQTVNKEEGDAKGPIVDATGKIVKGSHDALEGGRRAVKGYEESEQNKRLAESAQKDADNFKAQLTSSIKQWMSAREVVNLIKQGIRQAYQEIQNLDKAMTNIAVVTDMSVGELWGKIDQYMSLAQQYGVTTQGVYEVSQLYYQQGLGTAEVMEATTETLKMARIAGMGYAEAADAMTVAIRSFKMEMSDAAHVTDVYSKVAAVTASDTEELAIAMSKTASSAESVGSSFENTTAMLAVMVETTRESAQNLGSALKSIISRYGEMKSGLTQDSEGEVIDYNKTDAALRSVGISLKDAQGQFRNFDDVIFELSAKWDSLDKNTQRYIATIMAGNRQQSRFIALVDNWERLDEVAGAAQDSEDAGLLQYAKTLDSLETKLNNISTSFQQFYMSIINGPAIGGALEFVNNLIKGFNKLSKFTSIFTVASIVSGVKLLGTIFVNTFSSSFNNIAATWKATLQEMTLATRQGANENKQQFLDGASTQPGEGTKVATMSRKKAGIGTALTAVSLGLSLGGSAVAAKNQEAGAVMTSLGAGLSVGTQLGMINPALGVIAGIITTVISWATSWPTEAQKAQEALDKAQQASQEADIKRAEARNRVTELKQTVETLERLRKARYDSEEAEQAFLDASNSAFEKFPELSHSFDEMGNAIVDASNAEELLTQARRDAAEATLQAAAREDEEIQKQIANTKARLNKDADTIESRVQGNIASSSQMAISYADPNNEYVNKRVAKEVEYRQALENNFSLLAADSDRSVTKLSDLNFQYKLEEDLNWGRRIERMRKDSGIPGQEAAGEAYKALTEDFGEVFINKMLGLESNSDLKAKRKAFLDYIDKNETDREAFLAEKFATNYHLSEKSVLLDYTRETILNDLIKSDSVEFNQRMLELTSQQLSIPDLFQTIEKEVSEEGTAVNKFFAGSLDNFYEWAATKLGLDTEAGQTYRDKKDEWYRDEQTLKQLNASSDAARQATAKSWAAMQFNLLDDKTFEQLGKVEGLSEFIGTSLSNEVDKKLKELALAGNLYTHDTEGNVTGYTETAREYLQKAYDGYQGQFKQLLTDLASEYDIDDFNEFTQKIEKGTLTKKEIQETFDHFGKKVGIEGNKLLDAWEQSYLEELNDSAQRTEKAIIKNDFMGSNLGIVSISRDNAKVRFGRWQLSDWLQKTLPSQYYETVVNFTNDLQAQVEAGKISKGKAKTISNEYFSVIDYINRSIPEYLRGEVLAEFMKADLTSITGKQQFTNILKQKGLETTQIEAITNVSRGATNLVTEYNTLSSMVAEGLNSMADALKKSTEGMSFKEATTLVNTYKNQGLTWDNIKFREGKFYNTNINPIAQQYADEITATRNELEREIDEVTRISAGLTGNEEWLKNKDKRNGGLFGLGAITDEQRKFAEVYDQYYNEADFVEWQTKEGNESKTSIDYVLEQLEKTKEEYTEAEKLFIEWEKTQNEALLAEFNNVTQLRAEMGAVLEDANESAVLKHYSKTEAYRSIASRGITGYAEAEASQIAEALGVDASALFDADADGTYRLIQDKLGNVPNWLTRALGYIVSDQAKAFQEGLASLGEKVATGEETLDQQAVEGLLEEYGIENIDGGILWALTDSLEKNNYDNFHTWIKRLKPESTDDEILKLWQEYQRGLQKGTQEYTQEVLDSQAKIISGEMTAEDIAVLDNEQLRGDLDKFIAKPLSEQIDDYIASIIQSYNDGITSFDSATSSIKSAYKQSLISQFGEETSIAKTLSSREVMSYDTAAQLAAELRTLGIQTELAWEENAAGAGLYLQNTSQIIEELNQQVARDQKDLIFFRQMANNPYATAEQRKEFEQKIKDPQTRVDASEELIHTLEWQRETLSRSFADTIETFATATEVSASELADEYKKLTGREMSLGDARNLAEQMNEAVDPSEKIRLWTEELAKTGIDIDTAIINERLQQLGLTLIDGLIEAISDGISSLGDGVSGSLSAESFGALSKRYELSGKANLTSTGLELSAQDQRDLIGQLFNEAQAKGAVEGFGEQVFESIKDGANSVIKSYDDIDAEIAETEKRIAAYGINAVNASDAAREAAEGYLAVLKQIQSAAMLDPDNPLFNFMDKEPTDGLTDNFDNFVDQIDKVKETFSTFKSKGEVGYKDFLNMMDFVYEQAGKQSGLDDILEKGLEAKEATPGFYALAESLDNAGLTYEQFVQSVIRNTDDWGTVDIGGVAAELGISVNAAMSMMSESMTDGLKAVANQQIQYLSGLEAMLEAMAAMEGLNAEAGISFNIDINGDGKLDIQGLEDLWSQYLKLPDSEKKTFLVEVIQKLKNSTDAGNQNAGKLLEFFTNDSDGYTQDDQDNMQGFTDAWNRYDPEVRELIQKKFSNLNEYQFQTLASQWAQKYADESGKIDWDRAFKDAITLNPDSIAESYKGTIQAALADVSGKPIELDGFSGLTFTIDASTLGTDNQIKINFDGYDEKKHKEQLTKQLNEQLASMGLEVDNINAGESGVLTVTVKKATAELDKNLIAQSFEKSVDQQTKETLWKKEIDVDGTSLTIIYHPKDAKFELQLPDGMKPEDVTKEWIEQFTGQTGVKDLNIEGSKVTYSADIVPPAEDVQLLRDISSTLSTINSYFTDSFKLQIDSSEADGVLKSIQNAYFKLKELIETNPIKVDANFSNTPKTANSAGTQVPVDNTTTETYNIEVNNSNALKEIQEVFEKLDDLSRKVARPAIFINGADYAEQQVTDVVSALVGVKSKEATVTITTEYKTIGTPPSGGFIDPPSKGEAPGKAYTGTMNNISGSAFADGSIGRMMSGAQLANKVLVGELGPELAVYDGQYHMLGANGAEFVNLPEDAIIFNHLQTQGILNGQMNIRGTAMADGNVSGPAFAGGAAAALAVVRRAKSVWQGLLDNLTAAELVNSGGGGGGGGGDDAAVDIDDLEEWYNLSRKISRVEQDINNLLAERENIATYDGHEYANNLMKQKKLLLEQMNYQRTLLDYQKEQLEAQKEHILSDSIWSKFLTFDDNGTLQYIEGNETNGGKGALKYLQELKDMSAKEQTAAVTKLGYTYTDTDGKKYEGTELVEQFIADLQEQIDDYDELADTVNETEETLQDLQTTINEVDEEFRENRMELEQAIYDALVDAWEKEIDALEEQKELIEEANDAYVEGIQEALDKEQDLYSKNESIEDRESLQRQLALLRRSGGSASEIADLESQLNDALKDEYFTTQQEAIDNIQAANERQVELLEQQITIQEEALEYQKEHGILWQRVAEVMDGGEDSIVAFLQGNTDGYWEKSKEQQIDALNEWLKMSGIFAEEERAKYLENEFVANTKSMTKSDIVKEYGAGLENLDKNRDYTGEYNALSDQRKADIDNLLKTTYSSSIIDGMSDTEAKQEVAKVLAEQLTQKTKEQKDEDAAKAAADSTGGGSGSGSSGTGQGKKGKYYILVNGKRNGIFDSVDQANAHRRAQYQYEVALARAEYQKNGSTDKYKKHFNRAKNWSVATVKAYSEGGLADYTGLAVVHGSKFKPEGFLNAKQTAMISEAVKFAGDGGALSGIRATLEAFNNHMQSLTNITNNSAGDITIAPGAIQISVGKLNNSYDVDDLANDVMSRMVSIASKTTNRGVSRR